MLSPLNYILELQCLNQSQKRWIFLLRSTVLYINIIVYCAAHFYFSLIRKIYIYTLCSCVCLVLLETKDALQYCRVQYRCTTESFCVDNGQRFLIFYWHFIAFLSFPSVAYFWPIFSFFKITFCCSVKSMCQYGSIIPRSVACYFSFPFIFIFTLWNPKQ